MKILFFTVFINLFILPNLFAKSIPEDFYYFDSGDEVNNNNNEDPKLDPNETSTNHLKKQYTQADRKNPEEAHNKYIKNYDKVINNTNAIDNLNSNPYLKSSNKELLNNEIDEVNDKNSTTDKDLETNKKFKVNINSLYQENDDFNAMRHWAQQLLKCPVTPSLKDKNQFKPDNNQNSSNNLQTIKNSPYIALGTPLLIEGKLVDVNCIPIANAVIQLWQSDAYGIYKVDRIKYFESEYDQYFTGYGITSTNSLGEFSFHSIIPYFYTNDDNSISAPKLYFSIQHPALSTESYSFFFPNHPDNKYDKSFSSLSYVDQNSITGLLIPILNNDTKKSYKMLIDITANGVAPNKTY